MAQNSNSKIDETRKKSTVPPAYILPKSFPFSKEQGPVYGLEIKRAIEATLGNETRIACIQKVNGIWRIILWEKKQRSKLIQKGISVRGHAITVFSQNPLQIGGKDTVKLIIGNLFYSVADEEVEKSLKALDLTLGSALKYERYRDEEGKLLETETGRRFVYIPEPDSTNPLPEKVKVAGMNSASLYYKGMKKDERPSQNLDSSDIKSGDSSNDNSRNDSQQSALDSAKKFAEHFSGTNSLKPHSNGQSQMANKNTSEEKDRQEQADKHQEKTDANQDSSHIKDAHTDASSTDKDENDSKMGEGQNKSADSSVSDPNHESTSLQGQTGGNSSSLFDGTQFSKAASPAIMSNGKKTVAFNFLNKEIAPVFNFNRSRSPTRTVKIGVRRCKTESPKRNLQDVTKKEKALKKRKLSKGHKVATDNLGVCMCECICMCENLGKALVPSYLQNNLCLVPEILHFSSKNKVCSFREAVVP